MANRIVVLDGGSILEQGSHEELLARGGAYSELWRRHSAGMDMDFDKAMGGTR